MGAEAVSLDPVSEDAANAELALSTANGYTLLSHSYPPPPRAIQWASSADTEGESVGGFRYGNREIQVGLRVTGTSQANIAANVQALQEKIAKMTREGGTYKRTLPGGEIIVFDVLDVEADALFDNRFIHKFRTEMPVKFICKPFGRGASVTLSDHTETTLPWLVFTETGIKGDVPGLGKLVVDEDDADDQWFLLWGLQSQYYDAAATAALAYQAESLTPLGTAAAAAGPTGASGAGSNTIFDGSLTTSLRAILSTQASGGGSHMSQVGRYQVWARVQTPATNTGAVEVALEWGEGDFRKFTRNDEVPVYLDVVNSLGQLINLGAWEGTWRLVNLGQIDLAKVAQGTQRWEGRVLAKSTVAGDDIYVDYLMLVPVDEGYGEARATPPAASPTSFSARDEFDQTAGALAGKTLPAGGTWSGAGDADDFTVETTGKTAQRTAVSDAAWPGRIALAGASTFTTVAAQVDMKSTVEQGGGGVFARYVDTSNYLAALLAAGDGVALYETIGGTQLLLGYAPLPMLTSTFWTVRIAVDTAGRWALWAKLAGSPFGTPALIGQSANLATGGTLASGRVGIIDYYAFATAATRNYDNFAVWVPTADAVLFASQSAEIRHDRVIREDSAGAIWTPVSDYEGSYMKIPPAGREARTTRIIVKASRNDPDYGADSAIDDISARLTYQPRYLQVPEP